MKSKILWVLTVILGIVLGIQQLQAASDGVDDKQAFSMTRQGALLLDVREPDEYAAIHVPHAKLIPLGQLSVRLNEISAYKDKPIVVMCRSGRRSAKATEFLQESGFSRVSNIRGGITAWENDGLEVIRM